VTSGLEHIPAPPKELRTPPRQQIWTASQRRLKYQRKRDPNRDRPLSFNWRCDVEEIAALLSLPAVRSTKGARVQAAIVADALLSAHYDPDRWISYSRRNGWWHAARLYHDSDFSFYTVIPTIDGLIEAGILVDHDLRPAGLSSGIQSSYRPARWLADIGLPKLHHKVGELIRLKDADGKLTDYKDTKRIIRDRALLSKINLAVAEADIKIESPEAVIEGEVIRFGKLAIYTAKKSLYRVYKGSWALGGRYYGAWWQSCPPRYRKFITINGQATVERDYSQIHPRLLYKMAGQTLNGDAYEVSGWHRDLGKIAFNMILNAQTLSGAQRALADDLQGDLDAAKALIEDIKTKHPNVQEYFHTGIGMRLQNVDSEMCRSVLSELHRKSIIALPIHDSFIVAEEHENALEKAMKTALDRAMPCKR